MDSPDSRAAAEKHIGRMPLLMHNLGPMHMLESSRWSDLVTQRWMWNAVLEVSPKPEGIEDEQPLELRQMKADRFPAHLLLPEHRPEPAVDLQAAFQCMLNDESDNL